jgi:hypothetical protein
MSAEADLFATGWFEIDSSGAIWRTRTARGPCARRRAENRTSFGYLMVRQMLGGRRLHVLAHRFVWTAHHGEIPAGLVINHINGRKDDNRPANLEVVTYSANTSHAHRMRLRDQRGEGNPGCKISNADVAAIRAMYATGQYRMVDLASQFGITFQTVSEFVRGKSRATQGGPIATAALRHAGPRDPVTGRFLSTAEARHG